MTVLNAIRDLKAIENQRLFPPGIRPSSPAVSIKNEVAIQEIPSQFHLVQNPIMQS
jgi:hypothetical protein